MSQHKTPIVDMDALRVRVDEHDRVLAETREATNRHATQLDAHGRILNSLTEQVAKHGAMLLKHAELHTQHAEAISAAKDGARQAMQSTSDLGQEFRSSMQGLAEHMAKTEAKRSGEVTELRKALSQMASAQQQMAIQGVESGQAMATMARWHNHPLLKTIGAIIGAAIASYLAAKGH